MRHILVMTSTASLGVMALFLVDFVDIYFLSLLGIVEITAGLGFAGAVLFFTASVSIGLMIAMAALVAKAVGSRKTKRAKSFVTNVLIYSLAVSVLVAVPIWFAAPAILEILGAKGAAHEYAVRYLTIVIASMPLIGTAMSAGGVLRALGDARRALLLTLFGAATNAILDPILIFGFDLGIRGAAIATVAARVVMIVLSFYAIIKVHKMYAPFQSRLFRHHLKPISQIAIPAVLTNIATPIGAFYVTYAMAEFGDSAVSGLAVVTRLTHVAFGILFALSGAVGPIIGQNYGARLYERVRDTFRDSVIFTLGYVLVVSTVLLIFRNGIITAFDASGTSAELIMLFCTWIAITFGFSGALFVSNASFNNLGKPHYSTLFNFGRATLGTIPFVYIGAHYLGAEGVLIGQAVGGIVFGILAVVTALRFIHRLAAAQTAKTVAQAAE